MDHTTILQLDVLQCVCLGVGGGANNHHVCASLIELHSMTALMVCYSASKDLGGKEEEEEEEEESVCGGVDGRVLCICMCHHNCHAYTLMPARFLSLKRLAGHSHT
jgi:hypothetical protein